MFTKRDKSLTGFTLVELLIATVISGLIIGGIVSAWVFSLKTWADGRMQSGLDQDVQIAVEKVARNMRNSSTNTMYFYPSSGSPYTGISMGIAEDDDSDGRIERSVTDDKIIWDKTAICYLYNSQLRKTVFDDRYSPATDVQRQTQLNNVVTTGSGSGQTLTGESWLGDTIILEDVNVSEFEISPATISFDGYSSSVERSDLIELGSIILSPGYHYLRFKVAGTSHTGHGLGIDSIILSPSGYPREGEYHTPPHDFSGDAASAEDMSSYATSGPWSGDYHLNYAANAEGDYVTLKIYYDLWRETNFNDPTAFRNKTIVEWDSDYVVKLEGNETTWTAAGQTGGETEGISDKKDYTFRTLISAGSFSYSGAMVRVKFSSRLPPCEGILEIDSCYIIERDGNGQDGVDATSTQITFGNGLTGVTIAAKSFVWSDWMRINPSCDFEQGKEYFITFHIAIGEGRDNCRAWPGDITVDNSYYVSGDPTAVTTSDWSTLASVTATNYIYAVDRIEVRYPSEGTLTSQVYDTMMANPVYDNLFWSQTENFPDADVDLRVISSDNPDDLTIAALDAIADGDTGYYNNNSGNSNISGAIGTGRYLRWQARFQTFESGEDASHITDDADDLPGDDDKNDEDYDRTSILKDVTIDWPGTETMVTIYGYFTKRPSYGIFEVDISDDNVNWKEFFKGIGFKMTVSKDSWGKTYTSFLNTEVEPRNTGR